VPDSISSPVLSGGGAPAMPAGSVASPEKKG
jgi:hypothetical protein